MDAITEFCRSAGLPLPVREFKFHPERKWRFDWGFVGERIAVEQDGGLYIRGRHSRAGGYLADCEKLNSAALLGWRILRFSPAQVKSGEAFRWIEAALKGEVI